MRENHLIRYLLNLDYKSQSYLTQFVANCTIPKQCPKTIFEDVYKNKGSKTIIIISHQKFFYDKCDEVFELKNGKLVK